MKKKLILLGAVAVGSPVGAQDWTSFYGGGTLAYDATALTDLSYGDGPADLNGAGLGLFAGYNLQRGNLVYGVELAVTKHSGEASDGDFLQPATALNSAALRGRVGYVTGRMLPYVAVGSYRSKFEVDHEGNGDPTDFGDETAKGTGLALGVDWTLKDRTFLRVEIESVHYKDGTIDFYDGSDPHDYDMDARRLVVGYAMNF
jgi:outer membrane immunogenic protein